jgi:ssRNA-specific RNase YbeY (16S rRNA maturation enzyme)
MTILTRQERERLVLNLYSQGKTYHEISKVARISPRDIWVILDKAIEEKAEEQKKNKILLIQRTTIRKMNNTYLYLLKPTNSFPIERLH